MKTESLECKVIHEGREFLITYESESENQNLLMSILYRSLPIDTGTLINYDAKLYQAIKAAIKKDAKDYWENDAPKTYHSVMNGSFSNLLNSK